MRACHQCIRVSGPKKPWDEQQVAEVAPRAQQRVRARLTCDTWADLSAQGMGFGMHVSFT